MRLILFLVLAATAFSANAQKENIPTICIASDNYKVVFSWNEIFNNDVGKSVYIITAQDGNWAYVLDNRIAHVSSKDHMTGRWYVKGLQKIVIERIK